MKKLKVLHVASFKGNIGGNANHTGFRNSFKSHLKVENEYTDFEIREVFWKQKSFDELCSEMDLDEFKIDVRKKGYDKKMYDLSKQLINKGTKILENILEPWKEKLNKFHSGLCVWLEKSTVLS